MAILNGRTKKVKKLLASFAVLFGLSSMVACSQDQKEEGKKEESNIVKTIENPVEIEFWHAMSGPNETAVNHLVEEFNATVGKEKGITVKPVYQGSYPDLKSKITAAIRAKSAPAIAQAYPDWVAEYLQSGAVVELDDYIFDKEVGIENFDDIAKAYRDENSQYEGGKFYSLPFNKSTEVLYLSLIHI